MHKGRIEAFSDGVLAIIITVMVLDLKLPHGDHFSDLWPLLPTFFSYVLSFVYIGIYWTNHHHLFQAAKSVSGPILWANLHLLFWLSLTPFVTAWSGEAHFTVLPVACYGVVLMMAGVAYYFLSQALISHHGKNSVLQRAVGSDLKGKVSVVAYAAAIGLAFLNPAVSLGIYVLVALMWIIPDRRIEKAI
jgi:uncharacterized membrane protein